MQKNRERGVKKYIMKRELLENCYDKEHREIIRLPFHTFCISICKKLKNIRNLDTNLSSLNKLGLIIIIKIHKNIFPNLSQKNIVYKICKNATHHVGQTCKQLKTCRQLKTLCGT